MNDISRRLASFTIFLNQAADEISLNSSKAKKRLEENQW